MADIKTVVDTLGLGDLTDISKPPADTTLTVLTEEQILGIVDKLREIEKHNGFEAIAEADGIEVSLVKEIDKFRLARIAFLQPKEI